MTLPQSSNHPGATVLAVAWVLVLSVALAACASGGGHAADPAGATTAVATGRATQDGRGAPGPGSGAPSASGPGAGDEIARPSQRAQPPVAPVADQSPSPTAAPAPVATPSLPTGIQHPVRLEIPRIEVDAALVGLSLGNGDPEVPRRWEDAGWYETTRNPGEIGPAVVAGHVDSKAGPAVFHRLRELRPGDEVVVHGADGSSREFVVESMARYSKAELPEQVFGFGLARPELRLITCDGAFDAAAGHYVDNLVVYARGATS